jgi:hypothetical protein
VGKFGTDWIANNLQLTIIIVNCREGDDTMSEVAPVGGGGPNKLFIVLALGLVGLLVIGIVVFLVFMFVIQPMNTAARPATLTPTRVVTITFVTTPTRVALAAFTPTTVPPTDTPPPPTLVVQPASGVTAPVSGGALTPTVPVTGTVAAGTGTPTSGMPDTGIGENLLLLAAGVVLVFVIVAARRARATGAAA